MRCIVWLARQPIAPLRVPFKNRRTADWGIAVRWCGGEMFGSVEHECPLRLQLTTEWMQRREMTRRARRGHQRSDLCSDVRMANYPVFRVNVAASGDDLQPVQAAISVAGDEATVQQGGKAPGSIVDFEARDLAPCGYLPQPDRLVP